MRVLSFILTFVLFCFSCKNNEVQKHTIETDTPRVVEGSDTVIHKTKDSIKGETGTTASLYNRFETKDTILTFSISGLSAEGSEVTAHYINDTLKDAIWNIYGETGQSTIKYFFLNNGRVKAEEINYVYKKQLTEVRSEKDMMLKSKLDYMLDTSGRLITKISQKDFVNVFTDFKENVPFIIKK